MNHFRYLLLLFVGVLAPISLSYAQPVPVEQIVAAVRDLCQSPNGNGKLTEFRVGAGGNAKVKIKLVDGKVGGEIAFSKTEWDGVRKVLSEQQASENANYRECVKSLTPTFMEKLAPKQTGKTIGQVYFEPEVYSRKIEPTGDASMDSMIQQARLAASGPLNFPSYPFRMSFIGLITEPEFDDLKLSYKSRDERGKLVVEPILPYLKNIIDGKDIVGFRYYNDPFIWGFPNFSIKTVNNSDRSIFLSRVSVKVNSARIVKTPIPIFAENWNRVGKFTIENHGYGDFLEPRVEAKIVAESDGNQASLDNLSIDWQPASGVKDVAFDIRQYLPKELEDKPVVAVVGKFTYRDINHKQYSILFRTRVSLVEPPPGAPMPPSAQYEILLDADREGYTEFTNISQVLKPKEFDSFLFRIASTKYAEYDLDISVIGLAGEVVARKHIVLTVFRPTSGPSLRDHRET